MRRTLPVCWVLLVLVLVLVPVAGPVSAEDEKEAVVEAGRKVSIEYTLALGDGSTADSNVGQEPLVYEQGGEQILPALEGALAGLEVGDTKKVTITPEKGYGSVDPALFHEVAAELIPADARVAGAQLVSQNPSGDQRLVKVHEVKGDKIVIDMNHPLAGHTLHFDVRILTID